ncbi:MAG: Carbonic anhydrase 1 [Gammaproteobacteria bacterium]|nr:Carbonic anhydrase 1 [Gammaproteobacteria bacterium]
MSIEGLLSGYRRFRRTRFLAAHKLFRDLEARGQSPQIMFIACCDSRVDPATIFDTSPGEVFVLRNVANLVPPNSPIARHQATGAALEFAVLHLNVSHIVVMGHAHCGGAAALLEGYHNQIPNAEFIGTWMNIAMTARDRMMRLPLPPQERLLHMEYQIVRLSLENLLTYPWIGERVEDGRIALHGMHFGIADGHLSMFDPVTGQFQTVLTDGTAVDV